MMWISLSRTLKCLCISHLHRCYQAKVVSGLAPLYVVVPTDTPCACHNVSLLPGHWQGCERTERHAGLVFQLLCFSMQGGEPLRQGFEGLLTLQPGQSRSKAVMDPRPKGHVRVRV